MNRHDIDGAKAVILHLCRRGVSWFNSGDKRKAFDDIFERVGGRYSVFNNVQQVAGILRDCDKEGGIGGVEGDRRYILLAPPGGRQVVCLLGARWRLTGERPGLTLNLHLFGPSQEQGRQGWYRGYRLELPHKSGDHGYTHVQPLKVEKWPNYEKVLWAEQGVPDTFPAFPVRGCSLTTLCAALALALCPRDLENILKVLDKKQVQSEVRDLVR